VEHVEMCLGYKQGPLVATYTLGFIVHSYKDGPLVATYTLGSVVYRFS
jgi:hypothetical protein